MQKLDPERISSVNMENISKLAETFLLNPEEYMPWLTKCCNAHMQSKKLFFSILLQSLMASEIGKFSSSPLFHYICVPSYPPPLVT